MAIRYITQSSAALWLLIYWSYTHSSEQGKPSTARRVHSDQAAAWYGLSVLLTERFLFLRPDYMKLLQSTLRILKKKNFWLRKGPAPRMLHGAEKKIGQPVRCLLHSDRCCPIALLVLCIQYSNTLYFNYFFLSHPRPLNLHLSFLHFVRACAFSHPTVPVLPRLEHHHLIQKLAKTRDPRLHVHAHSPA